MPIYDAREVDKKPEFVGGMEQFYRYVGKKFLAPDNNKSGKIFMKFVIELDGSLTHIEVIRDDVGGTSEAVRVILNSPKWIPGENKGKKVRTNFALPITIAR